MKSCRILILALLVFLTACTSPAASTLPIPPTLAQERPSASSTTPADVPTGTPAPTKTATRTRMPTYTPFPSQTPTSFPRSLRTYDAKLVVTITPPAQAICPLLDPNYQPVMADQEIDGEWSRLDPGDFLLDALNQGATLEALQKALSVATADGQPSEIPPDAIYTKDVTGDNVPEVIYSHRFLIFFTCKEGKYVEVGKWNSGTSHNLQKEVISDLNQDGLNEIIFNVHEVLGFVSNNYFSILRWNGTEFIDLIAHQPISVDGLEEWSIGGLAKWSVEDTDGNGIKELVVRSKEDVTGDAELHGPWRKVIYTYAWSGEVYFLRPVQFDPPEYRFQAVQDGDRAVRLGEYAAAIPFYDQAIEDPNLKGWGYSVMHIMQRMEMQLEYGNKPTQTPLPPDPIEVPTLKAYAHYRKMSVYIKLGQHDLAQEAYQMLQQTYLTGQPGGVYADLAKLYWESYENEEDSTARCRTVSDFVLLHEEEIFEPIRGYSLGFQSLDYEPEDFCIP